MGIEAELFLLQLTFLQDIADLNYLKTSSYQAIDKNYQKHKHSW